jgi:hypothetical protein
MELEELYFWLDGAVWLNAEQDILYQKESALAEMEADSMNEGI